MKISCIKQLCRINLQKITFISNISSVTTKKTPQLKNKQTTIVRHGYYKSDSREKLHRLCKISYDNA